jgi:hypothetical protein
MPDVHLVDKIIEGGPQVEVGVSQHQGEVGREWLDLARTYTVLKSISLALKRGGPSLSIIPPEEVSLDYSVMLNCPAQFRRWLVQPST